MKHPNRGGLVGDCEADFDFEDEMDDEEGAWDEDELTANGAGGLC